MSIASADPIDRLLDPLARCLTPEVAQRIIGVQMDKVARQRLDQLAAKANEGTLTDAERDEYKEYVDAIDFIGILQAKAHALLAEPLPE